MGGIPSHPIPQPSLLSKREDKYPRSNKGETRAEAAAYRALFSTWRRQIAAAYRALFSTWRQIAAAQRARQIIVSSSFGARRQRRQCVHTCMICCWKLIQEEALANVLTQSPSKSLKIVFFKELQPSVVILINMQPLAIYVRR